MSAACQGRPDRQPAAAEAAIRNHMSEVLRITSSLTKLYADLIAIDT